MVILKKIKYEGVAHFMKAVVAAEMFGFTLWTARDGWDIIIICLAQYALFATADAMAIIRALKGESAPAKPVEPVKE